MRDINRHNTTQLQDNLSTESIRLTLLIDPLLSAKVKNVLTAQWTQGDFTYSNFSSFLRQALENFQNNKLKLINYQSKGKKEVSVRFPPSLYAYYNSIDKGKRSFIINSVLNSFLLQITQ